jgi:hypothetical protein
MDNILYKFQSYRTTHPNLAQCWLAYLALKKRHYTDLDLAQGAKVLECIANGIPDLKKNDMVRLVMYKHSII